MSETPQKPSEIKENLNEAKASIGKLWGSVTSETHGAIEKVADKTGQWFEEKKNAVTKEDVEKAVDKAETGINKLLNSGKAYVVKLGMQAKLLWEMLRASVKNEFDIPWATVASITATLLYLISPIDVMPDFIPGLGFLDDALVIALCLSLIRVDLKRYAAHKNLNLADYALGEDGKPLEDKPKA
ncbi:MAG: DUF1232 domain-containing protein [bacterium]|nr:DUF1232 domain-containing protein [bacterium]